jgi:molybdate transport system substrate-binding protein
VRRALTLAGVALVLASCSGPGGGGSSTVTVLAAASLSRPLTELARRYEEVNPGSQVALSFGPSDGLAAQIQQGAPADVFASASESWMDRVAEDPGVTGRSKLAANEMAILVQEGDPRNVRSLQDLADPSISLVLGAEGVPVGDYAREVLGSAGVDVSDSLSSNEPDASALASKVALDEADAAVAYATDAVPGIEVIPIPSEDNVVATYEIAVPATTANPEAAGAFVDYVLGPAGREVLADAGFEV